MGRRDLIGCLFMAVCVAAGGGVQAFSRYESQLFGEAIFGLVLFIISVLAILFLVSRYIVIPTVRNRNRHQQHKQT